MGKYLEKVFRLSQYGTNIKTEMIAGITTFVTMAYVLATVPNMLGSAGLNKSAVMTAVILLIVIPHVQWHFTQTDRLHWHLGLEVQE